MTDYNFLNLAPTEFEELSRDILQVREKVQFESFNASKDKGIDFRYRTDKEYIMVQAKRYEHYKDLKVVLVKELLKVKKQQPTRYILVAPVDFTVAQKEEVLTLFKGYIQHGSDILGKKDLNNLLNQEAYKRVKKDHYKLWLVSTDALLDTLDKVVYRKEHNLNEAELYTIRQQSKYYVQNKSFPEALDRIEENRIVLISGTPGVGKTTLGRALIGYFMATEEYELVYVINIEQAWGGLKPERKQIFFYDDFLAPILYSQSPRNEETLLTKFIGRIQALPDKIMILTTREYVLRQAQFQHKELKKDFYNLAKCVVTPETYSDFTKAKILYNHLFFSDLSSDLILFLSDKDRYKKIVYHSHYSPRLIDDYIRSAARKNKLEGKQFYEDFLLYLDHPREFWQDIYNEQSAPARLLLVVLFSLNEPVHLNHLKQAYESAVSSYIRQFNDIIISPDTYENILKELSDTFISINLGETFWQSYVVRFQNPSIKDFLLEYLRGSTDLIKVVLDGTVFLNQLLFAFAMEEDKIQDFEEDEPFYGQKIVLTGQLRQTYRDKFIQDFDALGLSTVIPSEYTDKQTLFTSPEGLLTFKLTRLRLLFGMEDSVVRNFIVSRFQQILETYAAKRGSGHAKILARESMPYFPYLVEHVQPFVIFDPYQLLRDCYDSISYTEEYIHLHSLGQLFPEAFEKLMIEKKPELETAILEQIEDDIESFEEAGNEKETDKLLDMQYEEVLELYGLTVTDEYTEQLYELRDREEWSEEDKKERKKARKKRKEEVLKTEKDIDELFTSLKTSQAHNTFASDKEFNAFLKQLSASHDPKIIKKIKQARSSFIRPFLSDTLSVCLLIEYYKTYPSGHGKEEEFWQGMFEIMYQSIAFEEPIPKETILLNVSNLALLVTTSGQEGVIEKKSRDPEWKDLSPLIVKDGKEFRFLNKQLKTWLSATAITKLPATEKEYFYTTTMDAIYEVVLQDNLSLWHLLLEMDGHAFANYYIIPFLNQFLNKLDNTTDKALFISFCSVLAIQYEYVLDESDDLKTFCMGANSAVEGDLIETLKVDLSWSALELFYMCISEEEFNSQPQLYLDIYDYIKTRCPLSDDGFYILNMPTQLANPEFYQLMKQAGVESYVVDGVKALKDKLSTLCN